MKILKKIFQVIVKIINHCVPVDSRSLYFIPHPNCRTDKYDIINYFYLQTAQLNDLNKQLVRRTIQVVSFK